VRWRRVGARLIDFVVVGFAAVIIFWMAVAFYAIAVECARDEIGEQHCNEDSVAGYLTLAIMAIAFLAPLIYDVLLPRTLGKIALDLELLDRSGAPATRRALAIRACVLWGPVVLLMGGAVAGEEAGAGGDTFGSLVGLYLLLVCLAVMIKGWTLHDAVAGTEVVSVVKAAGAPARPSEAKS
jgi:uncharacterized RDD family membrane protein YckC